MGLGVGCRLIGRCRARLLLSGTKVDFVGAKDRETNHLPRSFGYGMGWGCRLVGKLSDKSAFVRNEMILSGRVPRVSILRAVFCLL